MVINDHVDFSTVRLYCAMRSKGLPPSALDTGFLTGPERELFDRLWKEGVDNPSEYIRYFEEKAA